MFIPTTAITHTHTLKIIFRERETVSSLPVVPETGNGGACLRTLASGDRDGGQAWVMRMSLLSRQCRLCPKLALHMCVFVFIPSIYRSALSLRVTVLVVSEGSSFILIVTLSTGRRQLAFCHGSVLISVLRLYNDTLDSPTCAFGNACTRVLLGVCLGIDCDCLGPRAQARPA